MRDQIFELRDYPCGIIAINKHCWQQMEFIRLEVVSVFIGDTGFPTLFDEDSRLRYSNEGAQSLAPDGLIAAFCDHLICQLSLRSQYDRSSMASTGTVWSG